MRKAKPPSAAVERHAAEARQRLAADGKPNKRQRDALALVVAYETEVAALDWLGGVPKSIYADWAGVQIKQLHDVADTYGAPLRPAAIDLPALVRWLHEFVAANSAKLRRKGDGTDGDWREQERREQFLLSRLKRLEKAGTLVSVDEVHEMHSRFIAALRGLGDRLERQHGGAARDMLSDTLDAFDREMQAAPTRELGGDA